MNKILLAVIVSILAACNQHVENPVSPAYPCGTRMHACSTEPLACCWNYQDCGGAVLSCPKGMCCYNGNEWGAGADGGVKMEPQMRPEPVR